MEERRLSVKTDTIELNFLRTIEKLNFCGPKTRYVGTKLFGTRIYMRIAMLETLIELDLSGEEWDDDCSAKNGGNT